MKRIHRVISAVILAVLLVCAAASCSSSNVVMTVGDRKITKDEYVATAMSIKTQFITDNGLEEDDELWDQYVDSTYTSTVQQYLDSMVQSYLISYNLYAIHFDELGLSIDKETEDMIKTTLDTYINQYGSKEKLNEALATQGFSYESFESQYYNEAKKAAIIMYYFGPEGKKSPVSEQAILEYYSEYYSKIKHVFLSTKDKESNDLSKPEKEAVGKKAQEIYDKAVSGADFEALIDEYGEDPGMATNPDGYIFSTEDTSYNTMFHKAAFEMKANDIRLLQTNLGYHIMKKLPFTTEDIYEDGNHVNLVENMKSEESADVLDELKERIGVEYNNSLLETLSVKNLPPVTDTSSSMTDLDALKEQLQLEEEE